MRLIIAAVAALLVATPANAAWYRASSAHFVIYSEQKPQALRTFATKLERFDRAVRLLRNMDDLPLSHGNRVTIFVMRDVKDVRRLANDTTGILSGVYYPDATGSFSFVPGQLESGSDLSDDLQILLHEYAHHLMFQDISRPYPEWLVEGFAEFMSTAQFERDGTVGIGLPAAHRGHGLVLGKSLPLETLLSGRYDKITNEERESVYGRGWLMSHYLTFEPTRRGQLNGYVDAMAKGVDPLEAARRAFGDLKQLDRDLHGYLNRSGLKYLKVSDPVLKAVRVDVEPLSAGGSAILPVLTELKSAQRRRGASDVQPITQRARQIATQFPGDPLVETTLAEAEIAAGQFKAGEAAADRALKLDPRSSDAMILKGWAMMEQARASAEPSAEAFEAARNWFIDANKIDPEDPEPLMRYYESFIQGRTRPTANAIAALHYASDLAPQDQGLRMNSALQYLRDDKLKEARAALTPIAYNPHGGQGARAAKAMIQRIDAADAKGAEEAAFATVGSQ